MNTIDPSGSMVVGFGFHLLASVVTLKKAHRCALNIRFNMSLLAPITFVNSMTIFCLLLDGDNLMRIPRRA